MNKMNFQLKDKVILFFIAFLLLLIGINKINNFQDYSPTVIVDDHKFDNKRNKELLKGDKVVEEFIAGNNHLGTISIKFNTYNRINNDYLQFRIEESGSNRWYYSNKYKVDQFQNNQYFPFGFPQINDSKDKKYKVEIESLGGIKGNAVQVVMEDTSFLSRYSFPKVYLQQNKKEIPTFLFNKIKSFFDHIGLINYLRILAIYLGIWFFLTPKNIKRLSNYKISDTFRLYIPVAKQTRSNFQFQKKEKFNEKEICKDFFVFTINVVFIIALFFAIAGATYKFNPILQENYFIHRYLIWTKIAYILSVFFIPIVGLISYTIFNKFIKSSKKLVMPALLVSLLVFLSLVIFISKINFELFYKWSPLKKAMYMSPRTLLISLLITYAIYYYTKFLLLKSNLKKRIRIDRIVLIAICLISLYMARFALITEYSRYMTNALNLGVVIHSAIQVYLGKGLLVNIRSQYGLYGQFLEPVFIMLGGISIFKFSLVMATILLATLLSIGLFLYRAVSNKLLALAGFLAMMYFEYFSGLLWPYELYYQYTPIRTIFPALLLPLSYSYFSSPTRRKYYGMLCLFSIGILWNIDAGLFAYFAFVAALMFKELLSDKSIYKRITSAFIHFISSLFVFAGVLGIFIIYIFLRYGSWPIIYDIIAAQLLYIGGSVITLFRAWTLIIFVYFLGINFSIRAIVRKKPTVNTIMIFLLTVLGAGLITYHLNNPHDSTLTNSGWPAIIVFTLLTDRLLSSKFIKTKVLSLLNKLYMFIAIFVIVFFAVSYVFNLYESIEVTDLATIDQIKWPKSDNIRPLWEVEGITASETAYIRVQDLLLEDPPIPSWIIKANFLQKYAHKGKVIDNVLILSPDDFYLYMKLNARAPLISYNFWHLFLENEWDLLYQQLGTKKNRFVVIDYSWGVFKGEVQTHLPKYHPKILKLIKKNYKKIDSKIVGSSYYNGNWYPSELVVYERI